MTDKTIPDLDPTSSITDNALFVVDSGIETFKMTAANVGLYFRDSILPAGMLAPFAAAAAPEGWLLCYGQAISRSTYVRLFTAIGTVFGTGNGSTTFNLPDLRGRVVAGKDDMGGSAASRITNAVAGIVGTTLGAAGGSQDYTPAGTNGGSQSIAHTHPMGHTHNMSHVHMWGYNERLTTSDKLYALTSKSVGSTAITNANVLYQQEFASGDDGTLELRTSTVFNGNGYLYTTGVLDPPAYTSGADASTSNASSTLTGPMEINATVNGSNFTFTGTAAHRVQPTMLLNYIIKT